jgi:predicted RNase H-like HicB family nuclease
MSSKQVLDVEKISGSEGQKKIGMTRYHYYWKKEKEGGYSAQCLEISGAITEAETRQELHENMQDAILLVLESQREEFDI